MSYFVVGMLGTRKVIFGESNNREMAITCGVNNAEACGCEKYSLVRNPGDAEWFTDADVIPEPYEP